LRLKEIKLIIVLNFNIPPMGLNIAIINSRKGVLGLKLRHSRNILEKEIIFKINTLKP